MVFAAVFCIQTTSGLSLVRAIFLIPQPGEPEPEISALL
jgi:hypothetical protein